MNTIVQVPLDRNVRDKALERATNEGYTSLQDVLRIFLKQYAVGAISTGFIVNEPPHILTEEQEKHFMKRREEIMEAERKGEVYEVSTIDEMMQILDK